MICASRITRTVLSSIVIAALASPSSPDNRARHLADLHGHTRCTAGNACITWL
jgi:hypothetical protein